jgi:hypothetical protein
MQSTCSFSAGIADEQVRCSLAIPAAVFASSYLKRKTKVSSILKNQTDGAQNGLADGGIEKLLINS